jgi:excisionase family DNA binding protein
LKLKTSRNTLPKNIAIIYRAIAMQDLATSRCDCICLILHYCLRSFVSYDAASISFLLRYERMIGMNDKLLTTAEVSKRTGWSLVKTQRLCSSGRLPAVNTSTGVRACYHVREEDLERFLTPKQPELQK